MLGMIEPGARQAGEAGMRHVRQVVLQPASLCNLNCSYCYVPNRQDGTRMTDEVLLAAITKVLRSPLVNGAVEFLWHAGEPLAAGRAHFERAVHLIERLRPPALVVGKAIQTNGTLVNDAWADFLVENAFAVGVSIDGPAFLHDASRVDWADHGSHERVVRGFTTLARRGLVPGAICVLRRESLRYPDDIYGFFRELGVRHLAFNVEEVENQNRATTLARTGEGDPVRDEYRRFMERLHALWAREADAMTIREFADLHNLLGNLIRDAGYTRRPLETEPLGIITIHKNGDVSTFSPEFAGGRSPRYSDFIIGNIAALDTLEELTGSPVLATLASDVARGIEACAQTCQWFALCGGGYTSNKFFEHGRLDTTETSACRLHRQTLAEVVLEAVRRD